MFDFNRFYDEWFFLYRLFLMDDYYRDWFWYLEDYFLYDFVVYLLCFNDGRYLIEVLWMEKKLEIVLVESILDFLGCDFRLDRVRLNNEI